MMKGQSTTRKVDLIIIHCSDTFDYMDIGAEEIRKWHVEENGWSDIAYHFIVKRDGTIDMGRDIDGDGDIFEEIGAHTYGYNKNSIGICMVGGKGPGGFPEDNFTDVQYRTLVELTRYIKTSYTNATVHGHNEYSSVKTCPNFNVKEWVRENNV